MSLLLRTAVLGGDLRQFYLAEFLKEAGLFVRCFCLPLPDKTSLPFSKKAIAECELLLASVPLTKDMRTLFAPEALPLDTFLSCLHKGQRLFCGAPPAAFLKACRERGVSCFDYLESEELALFNAGLTAEGMLAELISHTPAAIQGTRLLLCGFGRCGLALAVKLKALGAEVTVLEKQPERRALAASFGFCIFEETTADSLLPSFSVLVNTAPAPVLTKEHLALLKPDTLLFDLTKAPGGFPAAAAKKCGLSVRFCPALPGTYAPKSAGEALGRCLLQQLRKEDFHVV